MSPKSTITFSSDHGNAIGNRQKHLLAKGVIESQDDMLDFARELFPLTQDLEKAQNGTRIQLETMFDNLMALYKKAASNIEPEDDIEQRKAVKEFLLSEAKAMRKHVEQIIGISLPTPPAPREQTPFVNKPNATQELVAPFLPENTPLIPVELLIAQPRISHSMAAQPVA